MFLKFSSFSIIHLIVTIQTTTVLSRTKDWQHVTQQCVDGIEEAAVAKEGFAAELNELDKESDKVHYHKLKLEYNAKKDLVWSSVGF